LIKLKIFSGLDKMAELETGTLIKIILGLIVVVAVVFGLYFIFKNQIIDFFKNIFSSVG